MPLYYWFVNRSVSRLGEIAFSAVLAKIYRWHLPHFELTVFEASDKENNG